MTKTSSKRVSGGRVTVNCSPLRRRALVQAARKNENLNHLPANLQAFKNNGVKRIVDQYSQVITERQINNKLISINYSFGFFPDGNGGDDVKAQVFRGEAEIQESPRGDEGAKVSEPTTHGAMCAQDARKGPGSEGGKIDTSLVFIAREDISVQFVLEKCRIRVISGQ